MENFRNYHREILLDIEKITRRLDQEHYTKKLDILSGSSVGQHIRHIVEFYVCLFSNTGYVNYDERERNVCIENSTDYCLNVLENLKLRLCHLDFEQEIQLRQELDQEFICLNTSYQRELIYLAEHTVHHFALLRIGLSSLCPDFIPDSNFGVAKSTQKYRETCAS